MKTKINIQNTDDMNSKDGIDFKNIVRIVLKYNNERSGIIAILQEIQEEYGYLPEEALRIVSKETGCSLVDVYGIATFYSSFSLKPRGKHHICACLGTACHVRGAQKVVEELEKQLNISPGMTSEDKKFSLETVNCLGACALGPVVVIGDNYFSKVKKSGVTHLINETLNNSDKIKNEKDNNIITVHVYCPYCNNSLMDETFLIDGYPSIKVALLSDQKDNWLRLSSVYGSYNVSTKIDIPAGSIAEFICPHCERNLHDTFDCSLCKAPMINMITDGGGKIQICSRKGCKNHILDLDQSKILISERCYSE